LQADPLFGHLVVHRPDPPHYLCLEPVSHVANGFNLADAGVAGTGTRMLAPGESMGGQIRIALMPGPGTRLTPP
jgi:aldose 1-epimerase